MKNIVAIVILLTIYFNSFSQESIRNSNDFSKGDIISSSTARLIDGTYYKSNKEFDENIIGVFSGIQTNRKDLLIVNSGITEVKYDNSKGQIKRGDFVTASSNGTAIKAVSEGMILGVALEDANSQFLKIRLLISYYKP